MENNSDVIEINFANLFKPLKNIQLKKRFNYNKKRFAITFAVIFVLGAIITFVIPQKFAYQQTIRVAHYVQPGAIKYLANTGQNLGEINDVWAPQLIDSLIKSNDKFPIKTDFSAKSINIGNRKKQITIDGIIRLHAQATKKNQKLIEQLFNQILTYYQKEEARQIDVTKTAWQLDLKNANKELALSLKTGKLQTDELDRLAKHSDYLSQNLQTAVGIQNKLGAKSQHIDSRAFIFGVGTTSKHLQYLEQLWYENYPKQVNDLRAAQIKLEATQNKINNEINKLQMQLRTLTPSKFTGGIVRSQLPVGLTHLQMLMYVVFGALVVGFLAIFTKKLEVKND